MTLVRLYEGTEATLYINGQPIASGKVVFSELDALAEKAPRAVAMSRETWEALAARLGVRDAPSLGGLTVEIDDSIPYGEYRELRG